MKKLSVLPPAIRDCENRVIGTSGRRVTTTPVIGKAEKDTGSKSGPRLYMKFTQA
jgi:hypothetical protein